MMDVGSLLPALKSQLWIWNLALLVCLKLSCAVNEEAAEYCLTETFQASCDDDQVILMKKAHYGRMSLGRCVKTDFGFVGCYADVLDLADRRCSGRRSCSIKVPDPLFESTMPCNEEFKSYLETSYTCLPVATARSHVCQSSRHHKLTSSSGYISNMVAEEEGCGTESAPWFIEAKSGQTVNFTLLDFTLANSRQEDQYQQGCFLSAVIKEATATHRINACGRRQREAHVYTSVSNAVEISFVSQHNVEEKGYFLLKYQIIGCSDPKLPSGMWLKREGDVATVGCSMGSGRWKLRCHGDTWTGIMGNCSGDGAVAASSTEKINHLVQKILALPFDIAMVIISGVAIIVGALIFVIGLCILKRRQRSGERGRQQILLKEPTTQNQTNGGKYTIPDHSVNHHGYSSQDTFSSNENEYAYVWDTLPTPEGHPGNFDKRGQYPEAMLSQFKSGTGTGPRTRLGSEGPYETTLPLSANRCADRTYDKRTKSPDYYEVDPTVRVGL